MYEFKELKAQLSIDIKEVAQQNKEQLMDAYTRIMTMAGVAYKEGLLLVENEVELMPRETLLYNELREMVELALDGTEQDVLEKLITDKFFVHEYTEIEKLLYFLYARSMLLIQACVSPRKLEELFYNVISKEIL